MFMGGLATSVWAEPRATYDIDGVIKINSNIIEDFLKKIQREGFTYDKEDPIKTIQGLPFITLIYPMKKHSIYVDLFLVRNEYGKEALSRRVEINLWGVKIPVISPEDLILYKFLSGRTKDLDDVRQILLMQHQNLDIEYLKIWAERLGVLIYLEDELSSLGLKVKKKLTSIFKKPVRCN